MNTTTIKHVNNKLKFLPDNLIKEVEQFIDYLTFKYSQNNQILNIPQEQIDIPQEHIKIIEQRLEDYVQNPHNNINFDQMMQNIKQKYNL